MSWEPVVYRDIWADDLRLIIDGKDVTYLRDVPTQFGGYQLQQPYGYGPANFRFPQVTGFEVDKWGNTAPLKWLREGAIARLVPIINGARGQDVWRGKLTRPQVEDGTVRVHCDGEGSGSLALRDRHPAPFWIEKDHGRWIHDAFTHCRLDLTPHLGPETGFTTETRGGGTDYLTYVNGLLADLVTASGNQWTIDPVFVDGRHSYELVEKDLTTVHATVFYGAEGVKESLSSDIQEKPTAWFGFGTEPDGQRWNNEVYPGLEQGETPDYPFADGRSFGLGTTNADTDNGDGIAVMHNRLISRYMDRADAGTVYDQATKDAIEDLQEDAGLVVNGIVNQATWDALFDLSDTGLNIRQARMLPLAEDTRTRKWNLTSSGAWSGRNPDYDEDVTPVDITVDHGPGSKQAKARRWSRRQRRRAATGKVWTGTIELTADVFAGDINAGTADPTPMSRLDLRPGMNIRLRHFDGHTLFHIAGINVDADKTVRLAVDTAGRDLSVVGAIIARDKESRRDPRREFVQSMRSRAFDTTLTWTKLGGKLPQKVALVGGQWNQFEVVAGQSGTLEELMLNLSPACEYVMGVSVLPAQGVLTRDAYDPFLTDEDGIDISNWSKPAVQRSLRRNQLMFYTAGNVIEPCGYSPGTKWTDRTDENGDPIRSDDPLTGEHEDMAGIPFHTMDKPVFYVNVYPTSDTVVQAGRVMRLLQHEGY